MHLQALDTLGVTKDKFASILLPMVESALPELIENVGQMQGKGPVARSVKLVDFLRSRVGRTSAAGEV